ncbi:hypothetical protein Clacol_005371 [Clathrus columnatus]|uniref:Uncharacterized protein n=1 Tax=Clathrus columnatus TaxID=1419009 RepID=A0AAV5AGS2_9AGAM|nr:hypothetical protein Clacol_005371 [Clathrus columnatus]
MDSSGTFRVSQWAPANETETDLINERLLLNGNVIGAVAYGVHATLYFLCLSLFWSSRKRDPRTSWIFGTYITINFILGSIGNAANIVENQYAFIDDRGFPGGPLAISFASYAIPINIAGFVAYVVNAWLQDGLLLYRFFIIFDHNYWIALIPGGLYIVSIIMSSLMLAQITNPNAGFFSRTSINFALTFWSISIGTTLLLTALIVSRLMYMKYQVRKAFVNKQTKTPYLSISATLVESAFLYSVVGLIFIITFVRNSPVETLFLPLLGQVQSIAPLLILLRVAQQRAWTRKTLKPETTRLDFVTITSELTTQTDSSRTRIGAFTTASKVNLPKSSFSETAFQDAFSASR